MKKIITAVLLFVGICALGGCVEDEDFELFSQHSTYRNGEKTPWGTKVKDPEPNNPYPLYVFPSVFPDKTGDFAFHFANPWAFETTQDYQQAKDPSKRLVVTAIYPEPEKCLDCDVQFPYFERLAKQFEGSGVEFVVLFFGKDREKLASLDWLQAADKAQVYYNSFDWCKDGLHGYCPNAADVEWFAGSKKANLAGQIGFPTSQNEAISPEEVYEKYVKQTWDLLEKYGDETHQAWVSANK